MGKRTPHHFKEKDFWPTTDPRAVEPLLPHIKGKVYAEPCWGNGSLEWLIGQHATCAFRSDIREVELIRCCDALDLTEDDVGHVDYIVTNPPYTWSVLKPLMEHFVQLKPTWLLLNADLMHNKRMSYFMRFNCTKVVSVGRVSWMENGKTGMENFAWYEFKRVKSVSHTLFYGREDD